MSIAAVTQVLHSLGIRCLPFFPQVFPLLLHASRSHDLSLREVAIEHLAQVIGVVKLHIRGYLPSLLALVQEQLRCHGPIQMHCISVVEELSKVLNDEFCDQLVALMPLLLSILHTDSSEKRLPTLRLLQSLKVFQHNMVSQLHIVVPAVLRVCEQVDTIPSVRGEALALLLQLCTSLDVGVFASRIVHSLVRVHAIAQAHFSECALQKTVPLLSCSSLYKALDHTPGYTRPHPLQPRPA